MYREDPERAQMEATKIIKNTYRVLMSRGMKGCYVYCTDKALSNYLSMRLKRCKVGMYVHDTGDILDII